MTFEEWWDKNEKQFSADACHVSEYHMASVVWTAARAEGFATKLSDRVAAMKRDELLVRLGQIGYERDLIVEELDKRTGMNSHQGEK